VYIAAIEETMGIRICQEDVMKEKMGIRVYHKDAMEEAEWE
jgi:hypothetical protein